MHDFDFLFGTWNVSHPRLWDRTAPDATRWEQRFFHDGGASWELNWMMDFRRN